MGHNILHRVCFDIALPLTVKIETLSGELVTITVEALDTVGKIAEIIELDEGIRLPSGNPQLLFGSNVLDNERTLLDIGVRQGDTIKLRRCPGNTRFYAWTRSICCSRTRTGVVLGLTELAELVTKSNASSGC